MGACSTHTTKDAFHASYFRLSPSKIGTDTRFSCRHKSWPTLPENDGPHELSSIIEPDSRAGMVCGTNASADGRSWLGASILDSAKNRSDRVIICEKWYPWYQRPPGISQFHCFVRFVFNANRTVDRLRATLCPRIQITGLFHHE